MLLAGLLGKCALTDAKGDMLFETISDVRQKISAGLMGTLAAEFPTEPGTFRLKDNTQGNYKMFRLETLGVKTCYNHGTTHELD